MTQFVKSLAIGSAAALLTLSATPLVAQANKSKSAKPKATPTKTKEAPTSAPNTTPTSAPAATPEAPPATTPASTPAATPAATTPAVAPATQQANTNAGTGLQPRTDVGYFGLHFAYAPLSLSGKDPKIQDIKISDAAALCLLFEANVGLGLPGLSVPLTFGVMYQNFDPYLIVESRDTSYTMRSLNIPIMAGVRYEYPVASVLDVYGQAQVGYNLYLPVEDNIQLGRNTSLEHSGGTAFRIGAGIVLNRKLNIGISYISMAMESATVQSNNKSVFHTSQSGIMLTAGFNF